MPRVSAHSVKSAIRLERQSTTVPNTSNTSAFTAEISDMSAPCFVFIYLSLTSSFRGDAQHRTRNLEIPGSLVSRAPRNDNLLLSPHPSIQVEFLELPVIGLDVTHRACDRAHHHGLG